MFLEIRYIVRYRKLIVHTKTVFAARRVELLSRIFITFFSLTYDAAAVAGAFHFPH